MTFVKAIKILKLLDDDKDVIVKVKDNEDGCDMDGFSYVDRISKYDEISDYMKYFMDTTNQYHFFEGDGDFTGDEIEGY